MKWKTPKPGMKRWKKRFAWWPTTTDSGYTIWFESYWSHEIYSIVDFMNIKHKWVSTQRLTIEDCQ